MNSFRTTLKILISVAIKYISEGCEGILICSLWCALGPHRSACDGLKTVPGPAKRCYLSLQGTSDGLSLMTPNLGSPRTPL